MQKAKASRSPDANTRRNSRKINEQGLGGQISDGSWQEMADPDNGIPRTVDLDGPAGLIAQVLGTQNRQQYQNNIPTGGTWNTEMAALMGTSVASERSVTITYSTAAAAGNIGTFKKIERLSFGAYYPTVYGLYMDKNDHFLPGLL